VSGQPRWRTAAVLGLFLAALAAAVWGWRLFAFLTDDAYIAFRTVHNHMAGHGWVWNPPPFRPVEGYTSFLWLVLLEGVWRLTGVAPPDSANLLSLAFGCATLLLAGWMVLRMRLPEPLARHRLAFLALVLLGTVTNRTWLAWLSSGLETALFNFALTLWVFCVLERRPERRASWYFGVSSSATLAALTRPDGVLAVLATLALLGLDPLDPERRRLPRRRVLVACLPLLGSPLHFLWRRSFYGEWLPNTWYAKAGAPWPEAGVRYLASFVLEYALWIWLALALVVAVRAARSGRAAIASGLRRNPQVAVVVGVLVAQVGYYTFAIGGDHFEYRIYSVLVPLGFVSFLWLLARLALPASWALAGFAVFLGVAAPLPWLHYAETRNLTTRRETWVMVRPVAPRFPALLRPYAQLFDSLQEWLIVRHVGMRHQEHKVFHQTQRDRYPRREDGQRYGRDRPAVSVEMAIGVYGWVLPNVAVIDYFGLTDHVIARTPAPLRMPAEPTRLPPGLRGKRLMAHDRRPPPGYVECFEPDLRVVRDRRVVRRPRAAPLTPERIRECESRDWPAPEVSPRSGR
jgi:arabinofuranosyltransferase